MLFILSLLLLSASLLEHMCFCKNLRGDLIFLQQWSGLNIATFIPNLFFWSFKTLKLDLVFPCPSQFHSVSSCWDNICTAQTPCWRWHWLTLLKNDALYKFCKEAGHHLQFPNEFLSSQIVSDLLVFRLVIVFWWGVGFLFFVWK